MLAQLRIMTLYSFAVFSFLVALVIDSEHGRVNVFGLGPTRRSQNFSKSTSTKLFVVPVDIADVVEAAATVFASTAASSSIIQIDQANLVNTPVPEVLANSASTAGGLFGLGGFMVGALATGSKVKGEGRRLEKILNQRDNEVEELNIVLEATKQKLAVVNAESEDNISRLENTIFIMDNEFEESTAELKRDYDVRVRRETERRSDKLRQDLQFSFDIKIMREREQMLQEKLSFIEMESSSSSLAKREEAAKVKLELALSRMQITMLKDTLNKSTTEVEELRSMIKEGKLNLFGNNASKLKLQVSDLQKDLVRKEETLHEKEEQIIEAKKEIDELQVKSKMSSNPLYFVKEMFQKPTTE